MKLLLKILVCCTILTSLSANSVSKDLEFVDSIAYVLKTKYAHKSLKEEQFGWDLDKQLLELKEEINSGKALSRKALLRFFNSANDLHVCINCFSTALATLPFEVIEIEEKYYVVSIDERVLTGRMEPGDQLIEWNGEPMDAFVDGYLLEEYPLQNPGPGMRNLAISHLTKRVGELGMAMPKGDEVRLTTLSLNGKRRELSLRWGRKAEMHLPFGSHTAQKVQPKALLSKTPLVVKRDAISPFGMSRTFEVMRSSEMGEARLGEWGYANQTGFLPRLGKCTWETPKSHPHFAYSFKLSNGKVIGFIRIPEFMAGKGKVEKFGEIISRFEKSTDGLIIDTTCNPGGSIFTCYGMLRHLSKKPLKLLNEEMMYSDDEIFVLEELEKRLLFCNKDLDVAQLISPMVADMPLNLEDCKKLRRGCCYAINQWREGKEKTDPAPILGLDELAPAKSVYTKPLLVLINRKQLSCGDYFPLILQDNGRAVLMGESTAGAGGCIAYDLSLPNRLGIDGFSTSPSTTYRPLGGVIEDNGAEPDIEYRITPEDLASGYEGYRAAILAQIDSMIPEKLPKLKRS